MTTDLPLQTRTDKALATRTAPPATAFDAAGQLELVRHRTARLAARGRADQAQRDSRDMMVCETSGNLYGFDATAIAGVIPLPDLTKVPQAHSAMLGIFGRNGRIFTAADLTAAMGLPSGERASGHLVLMRHPRVRLALRVDRALAFTKVVLDNDPGSPAPVAHNFVSAYARAADDDRDLGTRRIAILDSASLIQLFSHPSRPSGV